MRRTMRRTILTAELAALLGSPACGGPPAPATCSVASGDPAATSQLESGNRDFALALYGPITGAANGNAFFSPYSISSALAMIAAGANGTTASQLWSVLGLPGSAGDGMTAGVAFANLDCAVRTDGSSNGNQLNLANAVYGQKGFAFEKSFMTLLSADYGAPLRTEDFEGDPTGATSDINGWVSQETDGKIPTLLSPGIIDAATRLVLVNAIYFKGHWATQFNPMETENAPFTTAAGAQVSVPTMENYYVTPASYAATADYAVAELPYTGGQVAMDIVLPSGDAGLAAVEAELDGGAFLAGLSPRALQVFLPRFQISQSIELIPTLEGLGIQDAFNPATADFSGMDGARDLVIGFVVHQAVISVDETGSTAAAATAGGAVTLSANIGLPFIVDHPFLFFIRDLPTSTILFAGQIDDPSQ